MCSISWDDFLKNANEFVQLAEECQDTWSLSQKDNVAGNTYLVFRQKIKVSFEDSDNEEELLDLEVPDADLGRVLQQPDNESEELLDIEYHVVYSISYQVPVLYFRGYRSHGKPVGLDDAWKIFRIPGGNSKTREDMLSTLTQSDHPVLFQPFLSLHPCRTAEILAQMSGSRNIILTFISIMGPYVRLNLRNEYGLAFQAK